MILVAYYFRKAPMGKDNKVCMFFFVCNLKVLVFRKPGNPEKNPRRKDENQQQTQPTYCAESGNRTQATLVGGERSHHCAITAPPQQVCAQTHEFIIDDHYPR